ncbi:MAG: ParB/RepB/Spo0J family partition protein [Mesorhizobium sp.]
MSDEASRRRLGRGLAALIGDIDRPEAPEKPTAVADREVPVELIGPNPRNPRRNFTETDLIDLTASVKQHGIVQPVVVRPSPTQPGRFEIIAGERRWRAAQRAGLANVPVIVREVDDRTSLELAIVENVQRADLNPLEEALGYQQLIDEHDYVQNDLAQIIGKSRSHVANTLRLLRLPPPVRDMLVDGSLSAGHARTLITAPDPAALAKKIVAQGLSVRQAEALAQDDGRARPSKIQPQNDGKDADTRALEQQLSNATGLKISVAQRGEAGELRIAYKTIDQLEEVCRLLTR